MENLTQYWNNAITFEEYLSDINGVIEHPVNPDYTEYYVLNKRRIERLLKTYKAEEALKDVFNTKQFKGKFLVITEGWCGDAAQSLPVIHQFFKEKVEIKYIYRDANPELMDMFLTNGSKSIPIVIITDENNRVLNYWGPRPEFGNELLRRFKESQPEYSKDQFMQDMQTAYNKDKGNSIIAEILDKL